MCIFCMAAIMMIGASLSAVALGNLESQLIQKKGVTEVKRSVDTESTVMWKANVMVKVPKMGAKQVPVAIHLYKPHNRIRIQILTHEVSQAEAEAVQDIICNALDARVISRHFLEESTLIDKDSQRQIVQEMTGESRKVQHDSLEEKRRNNSQKKKRARS